MPGKTILVTAALPYANGPVHIGHAIGCYVPADVYARYHRMAGDDVIYICGTDEYGTPIAVTAQNEGISPKEVVDKYHKMHREAFEGISIEFTNFSGTARDIHIRNSQKIFLKMMENGHIYKKTVARPYCESCERFLPDRYVHGTCPKCYEAEQRGDQCEKCGVQLDPGEILEPICALCGGKPFMKDTEHWFFRLSDMSERLKTWISDKHHWPANARNFSLGWIREGLKDRAITRDLKWGVPVPLEDSGDKVLYVWFEAPIGYISSTIEWAESIGKPDEWKRYWTGEETRIVHFIGKDNIPFHAIIWPAMLMAHGGYCLPYQIASNEYLNLEGRKMSTSRGWVLWLHDCLDSFDPDALRYYLLCITPQSSDSDFSLNDFRDRCNNELIGTLGNLVNRVLTFIQRQGGSIPEPGEFGVDETELIKFIRSQPDIIGREIDRLNFINALSSAMELAHRGNRYFQKKQPWKEDPATTLYVCANLLRSIAIVIHPFLPASSEKIWRMLGLKGRVKDQRWEDAKELGIIPGQITGKPSALYEKIEQGDIELFGQRFLPDYRGGKTKQDDTKEANEMETVDFKEFKRIKLRTARIMDVAKHPNADKLYVLTVDAGKLGKRNIVAGLRDSYEMGQLEGKDIVIVANLEPAKIRGVQSSGMLLAASGPDGKPIIINPEGDCEPGSEIL